MIMLERLAPAENVGWYAAAYRLFSVATIPATLIAGVALYPVLARLAVGSRQELRIVVGKALAFLVLSGTAIALVFALFADQIVALLFPASYAPAAGALLLLAPAVLFIHVNWIFASSLLGLHQERRLVLIAVAAALFNPAANLVAIPLLRHDGAAIVTSLTELLLLVCLWRAMPSDLRMPESARVAAKALFAAAITAIVVLPVRGAGLFVSVPLALALFAFLTIILQAVSRSDLLALRALVRPAGVRS
jgi:O-antigen/teichoic acid export membrane protein